MKIRKIIASILLMAMLSAFAPTGLAYEAGGPETDTGVLLPADDANEVELQAPGDESGSEADPEEEPAEGPAEEAAPDYIGHWAERTLVKSMEDGLIEGFGDGSIRPDSAITAAQMITILTRVLGASAKAGTAVSSGAWYYEEARMAVRLGLIDASASNLDAAMTRQNAFSMMSKAFSLTPAAPDHTALNRFKDASLVNAENKNALAALTAQGLVQGDGGYINANGAVTRAEFLTVLYRVAENYITAEGLGGSLTGGSVVKGSAQVESMSSSAGLWFDCASETVSLGAVTVDRVVLKSHKLGALTLKSPAKIGRLVIDCGSAALTLGALDGVALDTVQLQSGGNLEINDSVIKNIEITGNNQKATIGGAHEKLIISGSNCAVTLLAGASFSSISITGSNNSVKTAAIPEPEEGEEKTAPAAIAGALEIAGAKNTVTLTVSSVDSVSIKGDVHTLTLFSAGSIKSVSIPSGGSWTRISCVNIGSVEIGGSYNTFDKASDFAVGEIGSMTVSSGNNRILFGKDSHVKTLALTGASNTLDVAATVGTATVNGRKNTLSGSGSIDKLTLNATGCAVTVKVKNLIDNSRDFDVDRVLKLVGYTYKGNYTLAWAEANDYEDFEKELWVNAKGYTSRTEYLIWINLAMQRVNIFKGGKGDWELIKSCIVGTGASGSGTPVGVYYTTYKLASGWTTSSYTCRPVVGFKAGSGYAFHSRLYYPNSGTLKDSSIGFPVSAGCIRMYDEDINYIYNSIPLNTTVVVY